MNQNENFSNQNWVLGPVLLENQNFNLKNHETALRPPHTSLSSVDKPRATQLHLGTAENYEQSKFLRGFVPLGFKLQLSVARYIYK